MPPTRLINIYGAPCAGKSTKMYELMLAARTKNLHCEICPEVAKEYAIRRVPMHDELQVAITREQHRRLTCYLGSTDFLLTDAPVLIGAFYALSSSFPTADKILQMCHDLNRQLLRNSQFLNVFIQRDHPYSTIGRYQSEEQAVTMAQTMLAFVRQHHPPDSILLARSSDDPAHLWDQILQKLHQFHP